MRDILTALTAKENRLVAVLYVLVTAGAFVVILVLLVLILLKTYSVDLW